CVGCGQSVLPNQIDLDCNVTSVDVAADAQTELGFSATDLRDLLPNPLELSLVYTDPVLGYMSDSVVLERTGDTTSALRVTTGPQGSPSVEPEVVTASWPARLTSASDEVDGSVTVTVEAPALDASVITFVSGSNGGDVTFSSALWKLYFDRFPNDA